MIAHVFLAAAHRSMCQTFGLCTISNIEKPHGSFPRKGTKLVKNDYANPELTPHLAEGLTVLRQIPEELVVEVQHVQSCSGFGFRV